MKKKKGNKNINVKERGAREKKETLGRKERKKGGCNGEIKLKKKM